MADDKSPSLQSRHNMALVELENYKLLVESVQDYAIFLLDTGGHIMTWNKGAERNKGYKASEIIGKHFSTFYMQQDINAHKPERELEIAKAVGRVEDEDWRVRKDGSRFWANVVITALRDTSGNLVGYAKVTRDLTERKQHEDNLRRSNVLLRKQQQKLQLLNNSKDEFISLASHQLRTPATAVKQLLGLLIEGFQGELPSNIAPLIKKAYDMNDRQIAIVNSLLKVAQFDAGKVVLKKVAIDINQLLQETINEQADTRASRKQTLNYTPASETLYVDADIRYLRMAFENLIDNASKYTHEHGSITIAITKKGKEIIIAISDTGVGIATEDLPDLFQKFKRIPNELSQKVAGSGLGLYWVREVISLHGGRIEASSESMQGTTFLVTLPESEDHA
jgi:PAS domain S-box-containing protein